MSDTIYAKLIPAEEGDTGYAVICLNLPGCIAEGETKDECIANIKEAYFRLLESYASNYVSPPFCEPVIEDGMEFLVIAIP